MTVTDDNLKEAERKWAAKVALASVLKGISNYSSADIAWKTWDTNTLVISKEGEPTKIILHVEIV